MACDTLMKPEPKPGILDITAYVGGRAGVPGVAKVHKLSSNESPLGPSPKALAAAAKRGTVLRKSPLSNVVLSSIFPVR